MIEKNDILKMVHHITKRSRGIPDKRLMHPVREWLIGLVCVVVVLAVGVMYSTRLFTMFSDVTSPIPSEQATAQRRSRTPQSRSSHTTLSQNPE